jgi:acyl dehydratase
LASHEVPARNDAETSENKIHDDAVAQQYGFRGGLVPGVTVYGYLTWLPASAWGVDWLESGGMSIRLARPVYAGDTVTVTSEPDGEGRLAVTATNQLGEACATGFAWRDGAAPDGLAAVDVDGVLALDPPPVPELDGRPPASAETLAPGTVLGRLDRTLGPSDRALQLDLLSDDLGLYDERRIAHPGELIRAANAVLSRTVRMGPWIHVASETTHLGLVPDGATVTTRARVVDRYERKEHQFVVLDVVSAVDGSPVMAVRHTAIYAPRVAGART